MIPASIVQLHRRGMAATLAVAALAAAGCGATSTAGTGRPAADVGASEAAGTPTTLPVPGDSTGPSGSPGPAGETVRFGPVSVPVPVGSTAKVDGEYLCLTLQGDTGCSLEILDVGRTRAAGGSVSTPEPGKDIGWWWGSDVPSCGDADTYVPVTKSTVVEKGFKPVGPKNAVYGSWLVSCQNSDLDFGPRLWWLPTSQIAFRNRSTGAGAGEAVDKILAGVTFAK